MQGVCRPASASEILSCTCFRGDAVLQTRQSTDQSKHPCPVVYPAKLTSGTFICFGTGRRDKWPRAWPRKGLLPRQHNRSSSRAKAFHSEVVAVPLCKELYSTVHRTAASINLGSVSRGQCSRIHVSNSFLRFPASPCQVWDTKVNMARQAVRTISAGRHSGKVQLPLLSCHLGENDSNILRPLPGLVFQVIV